MAMSRSFGWTLLTTRSPIEIVPEVMFSRPASIRSRVDLPQPEGPTSTTNSPSSIGIETPCKTSKLPNDLRTSRICTDDINSLPAAPKCACRVQLGDLVQLDPEIRSRLHRARGQPADHVALERVID